MATHSSILAWRIPWVEKSRTRLSNFHFHFHSIRRSCFRHACVLGCFSHVQLFATAWTIAHQAPLSLGFPRQEYWSGLPFPSPGALPNPEIEPGTPALADGFFTTEPPGKPLSMGTCRFIEHLLCACYCSEPSGPSRKQTG